MYTQLKVTKVESKWEVLEAWATPYGNVPKGFKSNGADVKRIFWTLMHPSGVFFEASVLHDYFYDNAIKTKVYADIAFYTTARHYGVSKLKATIAYNLVKWFGKGNYK